MAYDIEAIKKKIQLLGTNGSKKGDGDKSGKAAQAKLTWWKPSIGVNEIRFLPYDDGAGQPFQEVGYYNSKKLAENRVVAPVQWGLPDPIQELVSKLRKNRQDDATWNLMKQLQVRESYYAPIIVRGQEDKGVQIWEMSQKVLNQVYAKLSHPDYQDEFLFDPKEGYDFTVTAVDSGREFNGYPVKELTLEVRRKASPLAKTQKERDDIVASIPNLHEHFKGYTPNEEKARNMVINFLAGDEKSEDGKEVTEPSSDEDNMEEATSKINAAFDDL